MNWWKNAAIIGHFLFILVILFLLHWVSRFLPAGLGTFIRIVVQIIGGLFFTLLGLFLSVQIIQNFRYERSFVPKKMSLAAPPALTDFRIMNPLERPGVFRKAQLHVHTSRSYDSRLVPQAVIDSYVRDGYQFVAITDHDRYGDFANFSHPECLVIAGVEATIPALFWPIPLGKHLVILNPPPNLAPWHCAQEMLNRVEQYGGVAIPAHLNWRGGAGTGRWFPEKLLKLKKLRLVEINNPHSRDPIDFVIWHKLILEAGPDRPVWGVAVDDSHAGSSRNGWVMVKTTAIDRDELITALKAGAFYATNGPTLDITMLGREIRAAAPAGEWLRFYNARNQVVAAFRSSTGQYLCHGDEGFIRIEAVTASGATAWSQPFWLVRT